MKNHNIWFVFSLLSLVFIGSFGAINPIIALVAVIIAGILFAIWYFKEMDEQEKEYKKEMNTFVKNTWNNKEFLSENLTMTDIESLLNYITPWLENMGSKFSWDYFVNDMRLHSFIDSAMQQMYEIVNGEYKEEYELYPKQKDFISLWDIISEYPMVETIDKGVCIWETVRDKILEITREVLT